MNTVKIVNPHPAELGADEPLSSILLFEKFAKSRIFQSIVIIMMLMSVTYK